MAENNETELVRPLLSRGHGDQLAIKFDEAIIALLSSSSFSKAAKKLGIAPVTLREWMAVPEFARKLQEARRALFNHAMGRLQAAAAVAIQTLLDATKGTSRPDLKVKAADLLLSHLLRAADVSNVEERIQAIEEAFQQSHNRFHSYVN